MKETVSTSARFSNTRKKDLEYNFNVLFLLARNYLVLCSNKNKHRNKQTFAFIWIGFTLHKLLNHFQIYLVSHFHWLNFYETLLHFTSLVRYAVFVWNQNKKPNITVPIAPQWFQGSPFSPVYINSPY